MSIKAKIWKKIRGLQRESAGESNTMTVVTGTGYTVGYKGAIVPYTKTATINKTLQANQLEFEKSHAVIMGPAEDIHRVRCLDQMIHNLVAPFNGAARVPDKVIDKIEQHVEDVSDSLKRIGACKVEDLEDITDLGSLMDYLQQNPQRRPLGNLEYESVFRSPHGAEVRQRVAKFPIGG